MEQDDNKINGLISRLRNYADRLENLIDDVELEMQKNRSERNGWYEWHETWKDVWLDENIHSRLSIEDITLIRNHTSVGRRIEMALIKNDLVELKKELEELKYSRENLLRTIFSMENKKLAYTLGSVQ